MRDGRILVASLLAALTAVALPVAGSQAGREQTLVFDVYLDDSPVGVHRFVLDRDGDRQTMVSEADFAVKLLFLTAFQYEHRNREVWRDGCLQAIDSRTDSNGELYEVRGSATEAGFSVRTEAGDRRLGTCVRSFAYWNPALLDAPRLLNAQTGEHVEVDFRRLGRDRLEVRGHSVAVDRYALSGKALDITLYYEASGGAWIALDSRLENGRTLQYRLRSGAPEEVSRAAALAHAG